MAGQFNFVSPGAMASDALVKFLAEQEAKQRQAQLDALNRRNVESQMADRVRTDELAKRQQDLLEKQRLAAKGENIYTHVLPGQEVTPEATAALQEAGLSIPTAEGGTLPPLRPGVSVEAPPATSPGIVAQSALVPKPRYTEGGENWQMARQAAQDKLDAAKVAAEGKHSPIYQEYQDYLASQPTNPLPFDAYMTADANRKKSVTNLNYGLGGTNIDPDVPMANAAQEKSAQNMAAYRLAPPSGTALRTPYWSDIIARAQGINPSFDVTMYKQRQQTRVDFSSGKAALNIRSLNTAIGHMDNLQRAADALKNTSIPAYNAAKNYGAVQTGSPTVKVFEAAASAVANELATLFKGTGATDQEIKAWRQLVNANMSPQQLDGVIQQAASLMLSRRNALEEQWNASMATTAPNLFDPKAAKVLEKYQDRWGLPDVITQPAETVTNPPAPGSPIHSTGETPAKTPDPTDPNWGLGAGGGH